MAEVENLSFEDIIQQYANNIVCYKGKPVYVSNVRGDKTVNVKDLESGKEAKVAFNLKDFKATKERLGMVNVDNTVIYLTRIPVRRMEIGLNGRNLSIGKVACPALDSDYRAFANIQSLQHPSIADTLAGNYPTFPKAYRKATDTNGTYAFDRQFAIDFEGNIYYKTKCVGKAPAKAKSVNEIIFFDNFKHLIILLEGNHEKTVGIACNT